MDPTGSDGGAAAAAVEGPDDAVTEVAGAVPGDGAAPRWSMMDV
jgi:hypothetical protein